MYRYFNVHAVQALSLQNLLILCSIHFTSLVCCYFLPSVFQDIFSRFLQIEEVLSHINMTSMKYQAISLRLSGSFAGKQKT